MKKILVILIFLMILIGCKSNQPPTFENDFPSMKDVDHVYEKVNFTTAINLLLENTGVLIIGYRETNPMDYKYTAEVVPLLNEVAKEFKYSKVYYLDVYELKANNSTEYRLLLAYLEYTTGDLKEINAEKTLLTPDVYFINNGEIIGHHIGTLTDKNGDFISNLSSTDKDSLKQIYRDLFNKLEASFKK